MSDRAAFRRELAQQLRVDSIRASDAGGSGHPTPVLPGVDVATGSLGQGLPIGVGLALAAKRLDERAHRGGCAGIVTPPDLACEW
jgi:transketolase